VAHVKGNWTTGGITSIVEKCTEVRGDTIRRSNRPVPACMGSPRPIFNPARAPSCLNPPRRRLARQPPGLDAPPPDAGPEAGRRSRGCGSRPRFSPSQAVCAVSWSSWCAYRSRSPCRACPRPLAQGGHRASTIPVSLSAISACLAPCLPARREASAQLLAELLSEPCAQLTRDLFRQPGALSMLSVYSRGRGNSFRSWIGT